VLTAGSCPVPGYLPAVVRPLVPWTQHYVATVARRRGLALHDLWDEAVTALLRVALYADFGTGRVDPRMHYAQTAVRRACWRYVVRQAVKRPATTALEDVDRECASASAEDELIAREAVRRAWLLREHAAIADARGDVDTTTRLLEAATAATTVARAVRRRPRITPTPHA
jgi:hypothetical protein